MQKQRTCGRMQRLDGFFSFYLFQSLYTQTNRICSQHSHYNHATMSLNTSWSRTPPCRHAYVCMALHAQTDNPTTMPDGQRHKNDHLPNPTSTIKDANSGIQSSPSLINIIRQLHFLVTTHYFNSTSHNVRLQTKSNVTAKCQDVNSRSRIAACYENITKVRQQ